MLNAPASSGIAVLVVDDQYIVRRGIISTLADIPGMRCVGEAACGEEAIILARRLRPAVVLMDLRMPGIGGLEAARRIGIALPATRIIAVTAWDSEPPQRLGRSRIAACVGKDVRAPELEATIRRVLAPRRALSPAAGMVHRPNPFDRPDRSRNAGLHAAARGTARPARSRSSSRTPSRPCTPCAIASSTSSASAATSSSRNLPRATG